MPKQKPCDVVLPTLVFHPPSIELSDVYNEFIKAKIPIKIPPGYQFVRFGNSTGNKSGYYINPNVWHHKGDVTHKDYIIKGYADRPEFPYIIIKKIVKHRFICDDPEKLRPVHIGDFIFGSEDYGFHEITEDNYADFDGEVHTVFRREEI